MQLGEIAGGKCQLQVVRWKQYKIMTIVTVHLLTDEKLTIEIVPLVKTITTKRPTEEHNS